VPITPFHFGPGALVAVASRSSVSFISFAATNVLIDVESLYNMVTAQPRIHTFFHTYIGSTIAAALVVLAFIPFRWLALRLPACPLLGWRRLGVAAVLLGSLVGAWSHVLFDSVMHSDITPLAPYSNANPLYQLVSLPVLHLGCVIAGALGVVWYLLRSSPSLERP
jgi:membrane-bound metal-dependent hydrolase YbcI (DUF457 family)